jgi:hypothetical protein
MGMGMSKSSSSKKGGMKAKSGFKVSTAASGMQEVPTVVTDTTAYLDLEFDAEMTQMEYSLNVYEGTGITQAHLHCAPAGLNGPVATFLFGFATPGVDIDGELASGVIVAANITATDFAAAATCGVPITNIASLYEAILQRKIYLNVHSEDNPGGEVRGQIFGAM